MEDQKTSFLPKRAKKLVGILYHENRKLPDNCFRRKNRAALVYRYFQDMYSCLSEMHRVLKKDKYCIIIIGNNRVRAGNRWIEIQTDKILEEMSTKNLTFALTKKIDKELVHTAHPRKIESETIIFLKKR